MLKILREQRRRFVVAEMETAAGAESARQQAQAIGKQRQGLQPSAYAAAAPADDSLGPGSGDQSVASTPVVVRRADLRQASSRK